MPLGTFAPTVSGTPVVAGATQVTQFISTVTNFSPPPSAIGFFIQTDSTNALNVRWRLGAAASLLVGHQLEPGRDTGLIPTASGLTLSFMPETANLTLSIQLTWFTS